MLNSITITGLAAILALSAAGCWAPVRNVEERQGLFFSILACAVAGPVCVIALLFRDGWHSGFSSAIWVSVAATAILFALLSVISPVSRRLAVLLMPYLAVISIAALILADPGARGMTDDLPGGWVWAHIGFSVVTYGILTLTAVAGLSALIQDRALKSKKTSRLAPILPSLAQSETLETRLLSITAIVLACGVATGMSVQYFASGSVLVFDHKTIFVVAALATVAGLAAARQLVGIRGRRGARLVMVAWLFLTLAYPGVKLATGIIGG